MSIHINTTNTIFSHNMNFINKAKHNHNYNKLTNKGSDIAELSNKAMALSQNKNYSNMTDITNNTNISKLTNAALNDSNSKDVTNIHDYALEYAKMRKDIISNSNPSDTTNLLKNLDEAYDKVIDNMANSVGYKFNSFFGYSNATLTSVGMKSENSGFDENQFKNNLKSIAEAAKQAVIGTPYNSNIEDISKSIDAAISNVPSGSTINSMNLNEINEVNSIIDNRPGGLKYSSKFEDVQKAIAANEHYIDNVINSNDLTGTLKDTVDKTLKDNQTAFIKAYSYKYEMKNYDDKMKKLKDTYDKLLEQYEKYEQEEDNFAKDKKVKMAVLLLRTSSSLKAQLDQLKDKIKDEQKIHENLVNDPNTVVNTDTYIELTAKKAS